MKVLADASALVALIDEADRHHLWAKSRWQEMKHPVVTCESVVSEALHLLRRVSKGRKILREIWHCEALRLEFDLSSHAAAVRGLMAKYDAVPMSLADACLVRMSEVCEACMVWTLDADFRIYRRHGRQAIPVLMPEDLG